MDLIEAAQHPVSAVATLLGSVTYLLEPTVIEGLIVALWSSVGSLFTFLSISAFTVPRIFPELSGIVGPLKTVFAIVLVLYLIKIGLGVYDNFEDNL